MAGAYAYPNWRVNAQYVAEIAELREQLEVARDDWTTMADTLASDTDIPPGYRRAFDDLVVHMNRLRQRIDNLERRRREAILARRRLYSRKFYKN